MEHEQIKHDKAYPPSASEGGDNAYYLKGCDIAGRVPAYCSCLFKIKEVEAGRELYLSKECIPAIEGNQCRAKGMREQEKLMGMALYYFPRKKIGDQTSNINPSGTPWWKQEMPAMKEMTVTQPVVSKPKSIIDDIDTGSYADALNRAPAPQPEKRTMTKEDLMKLALPGESLVDAAKRLLAQRKG